MTLPGPISALLSSRKTILTAVSVAMTVGAHLDPMATQIIVAATFAILVVSIAHEDAAQKSATTIQAPFPNHLLEEFSPFTGGEFGGGTLTDNVKGGGLDALSAAQIGDMDDQIDDDAAIRALKTTPAHMRAVKSRMDAPDGPPQRAA